MNLFGSGAVPAQRYAALVCAATATVAVGYRVVSRLAVPAFAALVVAQPLLPLLAASQRPSVAEWSLIFTGVALLDLAVVWAFRRDRARGAYRLALKIMAWTLHGSALVLGGLGALAALAAATQAGDAALAAAALVAAALRWSGQRRSVGSPLPSAWPRPY